MEWGRSNGQKMLWFGSVGIPASDYNEAIQFCERVIARHEEKLHLLSGRDYWNEYAEIRRNMHYINQIKLAMKEESK